MIVVNPNEPIEYRLQDGDDAVFLLRPMTVAMEKRISGLVARSPGGFNIEVLRMGLAGWDRVNDADGQPVSFDVDRNGQPIDDTLNRLPMSVRAELAMAILRSGKVTEDDLKNLR